MTSTVLIAGTITGDFPSGGSNDRDPLTADRTYYIATTGNNLNAGTSAAPWATLQYAWNFIRDNLDLHGFKVTVNVANGSYGGLVASGRITGANGAPSVQFVGNTTSPQSVYIDAGTGDAIAVGSGAELKMSGFGTQGYRGVVSAATGYIQLGAWYFGPCSHAHIQACGPGAIVETGYVIHHIGGGAPNHALAEQGGTVNILSCEEHFDGTFNYSLSYVHANQCGRVDFTGSVFTGSATGVRYDVRSGGGVSVNGAGTSFLPGNTAGSNSGGWYV